MSFITTILLFHIISFIKIKCQNLSFKIQIKQGTGNKTYSIPLFPLKVGDTEVDTVYSGLKSNSEVLYAFSSKQNEAKINGKYYKADDKKKLNKSKSIKFFGEERNGNMYKDKITIGNKSFELEFVYVDILGIYNGYINFGSKSLEYLKNNKIISKATIHYSPYNDKNGSMEVEIGGSYNFKNPKFTDTCKIENEYSGCILKKMYISSNGTETNNKNESFEVNAQVEFFNSELFLNKENIIVGNPKIVNDIQEKLNKIGFNCTNGICEPKSTNKSLYLVFGEKGIKLSKIYFAENQHPNLIFGFNTLKDVDIVLDYDEKKVSFYSGYEKNSTKDTNVPSDKDKSKMNKIIIICAIVVGILIVAVVLYYCLFHKKEKGDFAASGAENLLPEDQ